MFRASRTPPTGEDPFLPLKIALFIAGAAFGIVGMTTGTNWPVTLGIVLLIAGWVLRFATRRVAQPPGSDDGE